MICVNINCCTWTLTDFYIVEMVLLQNAVLGPQYQNDRRVL